MKSMEFDVDYRRLRLSNLNTSEYRHVLLLLFWPIFGLIFAYAERGYKADYYYPMYCELDDLIPFNEYFIIPYIFWFVFVAGMLAFTFFFDVETFTRMMKFIVITYGASLVVFFLFPNCQMLRPIVFERDNIFTRFISEFYKMDTNTNVCPSIHVIGSFAAMFAGLRCKRFQKQGIKVFFVASTILITSSTVFLKQHSILDVIAAIPVCVCGYLLCFYIPHGKRKDAKEKEKTAVAE